MSPYNRRLTTRLPDASFRTVFLRSSRLPDPMPNDRKSTDMFAFFHRIDMSSYHNSTKTDQARAIAWKTPGGDTGSHFRRSPRSGKERCWRPIIPAIDSVSTPCPTQLRFDG
ncbi:hypothetical protein GCM10023158_05700 [Gluconacetobacter tumulicola]